MSTAGRCAAPGKNKKAASPLTYESLPRSRRGDAPREGYAAAGAAVPAHKLTPGIQDVLVFDSQGNGRNYKNPLTGSVYASRGLPQVSVQCLVPPDS